MLLIILINQKWLFSGKEKPKVNKLENYWLVLGSYLDEGNNSSNNP